MGWEMIQETNGSSVVAVAFDECGGGGRRRRAAAVSKQVGRRAA